jgi:thymidylate synthase ThyX
MTTDNNHEREIFAVTNMNPEDQAYAMASYSRSNRGLKKSVEWMEEKNKDSGTFLDTFYFQYGHKSIADMAHVSMGFENVSILAAQEIEDERLWDGQEQSTRYQDFTKRGYHIPADIEHNSPGSLVKYIRAVESLLRAYERQKEKIFQALSNNAYVEPGSIDAGSAMRAFKARSFDIARALLPYGVYTSLCQVTSARSLEGQINRLLTSPYHEVVHIGLDMKKAVSVNKAYSPLDAKVAHNMEVQGLSPGRVKDMLQVVNGKPVAPTLVKYTGLDEQRLKVEAEVRQVVKDLTKDYEPKNEYGSVFLHRSPGWRDLEVAATLIYRYSNLSYEDCQIALDKVGSNKIYGEVAELAFKFRGEHDSPLRETHTGYQLIFDILMDGGGMRDLYRHRDCIQIRQDITASHGYIHPKEWFYDGLPEEIAAILNDYTKGAVISDFDLTLMSAWCKYDELDEEIGVHGANYMLPLGFKRRTLFKMSPAQAQYIIETRSGVNGHFSYRKVVTEMYDAMVNSGNLMANKIRVQRFTSPSVEQLLNR